LIPGETHYQDCPAGTPQAHQRCTLANKEKRHEPSKRKPAIKPAQES
jgi:hypothetical protein